MGTALVRCCGGRALVQRCGCGGIALTTGYAIIHMYVCVCVKQQDARRGVSRSAELLRVPCLWELVLQVLTLLALLVRDYRISPTRSPRSPGAGGPEAGPATPATPATPLLPSSYRAFPAQPVARKGQERYWGRALPGEP